LIITDKAFFLNSFMHSRFQMRMLHCAYARLPAVSSKLHFRIASRFVIDRYES